jgi:hypothetical protein
LLRHMNDEVRLGDDEYKGANIFTNWGRRKCLIAYRPMFEVGYVIKSVEVSTAVSKI